MATNARKDFPVFDCDSHVVEPPAIWDEYVPARSRAWVKTQFCFHTDSDLLFINGRVVPAARERSNAAEVGWACLLYTSPSPRDRQKSRMPSSA